jgi:UDP-N-acetylenolpyruvoylglucosamine reductase
MMSRTPTNRWRVTPLCASERHRAGSPAPNSEDELIAVLEAARRDGVRVQNLGGGSNLVASDESFDGLVLKLGAGFAWQRVEGHKSCGGRCDAFAQADTLRRQEPSGQL